MSLVNTNDLDFRMSCQKYLAGLVARKDFAEAARYFESLREVWNDRTDVDSGIMMRLGAKAYSSLGDFSKALPLIRTAILSLAQSSGDSGELGDGYLTLGDILRDMGNYNESEKAYRDAESIHRRNDDIARAGDALNRLAGILFRKGDFEASLRYLLEAVEAARRINDNRRLAYLFGNIGRVYTFLGKLSAAEENIRLNIELSTQFRDDLEIARAYLSLGYLQMQRERLEEAAESFENALELIRRGEFQNEEIIYLTYCGELAVKEGRNEDAERMLEEAVAKAGKLAPESLLAARPLRHLAELWVRRENFRKALVYANSAMAAMKRLDDAVEIGALHRIIAVCQEALERPDKARAGYLESIELLQERKAKFELAESLTVAGISSLFEAGKKLIYLCRAEEIYAACGIAVKAEKTQRLISSVQPNSKNSSGGEIMSAETTVGFPTRSPRMEGIVKQLHLLKSSRLPLLLTGETGTGKDFMARYFHSIARPTGPYLAVNCAAVPDTLIESELFGYQRGAFTGADNNRRGLFMAANRGVLLLDEIGELPLSLQAKLLSILETRKLRPLGTSEEFELDLIVIAATNRDLTEMVKAGLFRSDLYYRLAGIAVEIPPLRERKEDIPFLLEFFMRREGLLSEGDRPSAELVRQFLGYDWPGNIRQLENKVKQLAALSAMARDGSIAELARSFFDTRREETANSLFEQVEKFEKRLLMEALAAANGNKSEAARILSIHESTLRAKMKRYCLETTVN
ncbi:MAG: sigma 54-interacting transcriptional regulator [Candidatus Zixiibacteriota bacterium]